MVNGTAPAAPVRRREIAETDLSGMADLLARGFPKRSRDYWARGLDRMARRTDVPPGCPRFGSLLEAQGRPVGALLMLFRTENGRLLCNLSSWTVEPDYRLHAPLLVAAALRQHGATFTNLSPAPHTWPTIEAQGFERFADRSEIVFPTPSRRGRDVVVFPEAGGFAHLAEASLLDDHVGYGCLVAVVSTAEGPQPFVFLPLRVRSGRIPLPLAQLVYCRDLAAYRRLAGALGRALLGRGVFGVVVDETGPPSVWNRLLARRRRRRYFRGPTPPPIGNLAYTERVIFGP